MESGAHKPIAKKSLAASMQRFAQYSEITLLGGGIFKLIYHDGNLHRYQGNQRTFSAGTTNRKKDEFGKQFSFPVTASEIRNTPAALPSVSIAADGSSAVIIRDATAPPPASQFDKSITDVIILSLSAYF